MSTNSKPTCPSGCAGILPQLDFSYCDPVLGYGEIGILLIANVDAECFTDWTSITEWLARISNTSADPDAIRYLHVKADKPVGERETIEISMGRKVKGPGTFTVNIDVDDVSDLNHEFMLASQCNTVFKMWYIAGPFLWGGTCGINAVLNLDYKIDRGSKSIQLITGTATWDADFSPERTANPLSGMFMT